jgi:N,N'-diacetyllegionaminate synthase
VARNAESILLSTGMATLGEIDDALHALEDAGANRDRIVLLHCTTEYPAPLDEVNLRAMIEMRDAFGLEVGYSDHTAGIEAAIAAVALGAVVIEKHFTLDRTMRGPDHAASLEPSELSALVSSSANVASALGDGHKAPGVAELRNAPIVRKSIVAARSIEAGEAFTEHNLTAKRPGTGLSPMLWDSVVGAVAPRSFQVDEMIEL